jgi:hypothetical protein
MGKKIKIMIMAVLLIACMAAAAIAAEKITGKVASVSGDKITVVLEAVPAWIKAGATIKAGNGAPRIISVKGNEVILRFSRSKAAKIKVGAVMPMEESEGEELQGC